MTRKKMVLVAVAVVAVTLSLLNASWLAPRPTGQLIMVSHRGVAQQFSREGVGRDTCTANRIAPPDHNYIENTIRSMRRAVSLGADMIELDVHPTSDGHMVVFHDWTLDCRTNGRGVTREHSLAQLKALDVGHGYTADGGKTFPLRGNGIGAMPTVEEVLQALPRTQFLFNFKSRDPRDADILVQAFARAGVPIDDRFSFYGHERVLNRMRRHAPKSWIWSKAEVQACAMDYLKFGWTGHVPQSCRGRTIMVPLNYRWAVWGWPYRFLDRMAGANTRVILLGDVVNDRSPIGLERAEQLGDVPRNFRGYLWVEDIYEIGRSLQR
jgi:glycerophosphoryl diester phosphodiesterase